jgi:GNAT superfamily N-acetyltransferase
MAEVSALWVADAVRRHGHGGRLLAAAEAYALERGCIGVFLDTFSFQARPFYERHGYCVFATLADCPPGHESYFLQKRLKQPE